MIQCFPLTTNQHQPGLSAPKPTSEQAEQHKLPFKYLSLQQLPEVKHYSGCGINKPHTQFACSPIVHWKLYKTSTVDKLYISKSNAPWVLKLLGHYHLGTVAGDQERGKINFDFFSFSESG